MKIATGPLARRFCPEAISLAESWILRVAPHVYGGRSGPGFFRGSFALHRRVRPVIFCALALLVVHAHTTAWSDEPKGDARPPVSPIQVFVETPLDLQALIKRLSQPDFVIETGASYDQRRAAAAAASASSTAVVESISVRGEVFDEIAHLTIDAVIVASMVEPVKVPLGLDSLTLIEAEEGEKRLPVSATADGGWQVEVRGAGRHTARIRALGRVKPGAEGPRLEFGIPQVASTSVDLNVGPGVRTALAGAREPMAAEPTEGGQRTKLAAHLSPRKRLDLTWLVESDARTQGPLQLSAQGEIALVVDPGSLRSQSSWLVRCDQGTTRALSLRIDPADELLSVEINDRPLAADGQRDRMSGVLTIPLAEVLRPGRSLRLAVTTRRTFPSGATSTRLTYQGTPIEAATTQSGVVAVARSGDLAIMGAAARTLSQIDPRNELPQGLRARPSTVLAYRFYTQPIELELRIDPSSPHARVETRTTVSVAERLARVETRLDYHVAGGPLFEARIGVPDGLEWESAGPEGVVTSSQLLPAGASADVDSTTRVLLLTLSAKAREAGAFSIVLNGRQTIDPTRPVNIDLFQPRQAALRGARVVVLAARSLELELAGSTGLTPSPGGPPADWPWPENVAGATTTPALWLRDDAMPAALPLKVTVFPRVLRHESSLFARVDRRSIEARQEIHCRIQHDALSRIDIAVPQEIERRWELDGAEVSSRSRLTDGPRGEARYRLFLARETNDSLRLRFRYRLPLPSGRSTKLELPLIRLLEGSGPAPRIELAAEPGIRIEPDGNGWERPSFEDSAVAREGGSPVVWIRPSSATAARPAIVSLSASALAELPTLVVSRLWLRTTQGVDGDLITSAWYRIESHGPSFSFALPKGAALERAWVGAESIREPVHDRARDSYRLPFPSSADPGSTVVGLEYSIPAATAASRWEPPLLMDGARVQHSAWTIRSPWTRMLIGAPADWLDENEWFWSVYMWRRRPIRDDASLVTWIAAQGPTAAMLDDLDVWSRSSTQAYLFSRPGDPVALRVNLLSRPILVGISSGVVLAAGLLLLRLRASANVLASIVAVCALAIFVLVEPSVVFQGLQSSVAGVVLFVLALITQQVVDRRRTARASFTDGAPTPSPAPGARGPVPDVGSDESTVIRARPASTADHVPIARSVEEISPGLTTDSPHAASRF
jgi:hypothetical protein